MSLVGAKAHSRIEHGQIRGLGLVGRDDIQICWGIHDRNGKEVVYVQRGILCNTRYDVYRLLDQVHRGD